MNVVDVEIGESLFPRITDVVIDLLVGQTKKLFDPGWMDPPVED